MRAAWGVPGITIIPMRKDVQVQRRLGEGIGSLGRLRGGRGPLAQRLWLLSVPAGTVLPWEASKKERQGTVALTVLIHPGLFFANFLIEV